MVGVVLNVQSASVTWADNVAFGAKWTT